MGVCWITCSQCRATYAEGAVGPEAYDTCPVCGGKVIDS